MLDAAAEMTIPEAHLRELVRSEEGQYFERKSLFEGLPGQKRPRSKREVRDQVAEYAAGFANADGGTLVLGVEDDGTITGHEYAPEVIDEILRVPEARLEPPQPRGQVVHLDGHDLLVFVVEPAARAVMVTANGYPLRNGDTTTAFAQEKINAIKDRGLVESAEARTTDLPREVLDEALIASAARLGGAAYALLGDYLVARRLADRKGDTLALRQAAVLLFAREPSAITHPNAGVRVFRVAGRTATSGRQHNVQEFPRLEGNLPSVLTRARDLLETLIQRSARLHDLFFEEAPEYPTLAWQEALVNAVAHRDYAIQGQSVEVWLYDDRMEVLSPGPQPPEVSLDELKVGRAVHASRNPRIARVLTELGIMREQGEGIPRMFEEMALSLLPLPEIDVVAGRFRVTLRSEPIFSAGVDHEWARTVRAMPLAVTQKRALVGLQDRDFANADYCKLNGVDRDIAYEELRQLVDAGLLDATGTGPGTRYRVHPRGPAPSRTPLQRLIARMTESGSITNTDYREAFGTDRRAAQLMLARWTTDGVVVREGEKRGTRYLPGPAWPPAA